MRIAPRRSSHAHVGLRFNRDNLCYGERFVPDCRDDGKPELAEFRVVGNEEVQRANLGCSRLHAEGWDGSEQRGAQRGIDEDLDQDLLPDGRTVGEQVNGNGPCERVTALRGVGHASERHAERVARDVSVGQRRGRSKGGDE